MLPTPDTSHVDYNYIYEPAEDSYLLLDTLASETEVKLLSQRFQNQVDPHNAAVSSPLVVEVGTGSGVVLAFITAHAQEILGRSDVLSLGIDINRFACLATTHTVNKADEKASTSFKAGKSSASSPGTFLAALNGDLLAPIRAGVVDILIFNPPYVPTSELQPVAPQDERNGVVGGGGASADSVMDVTTQASRLLELSYAGGRDGMEVTSRLLAQLPTMLNLRRGVAYILMCQQNKPDSVVDHIRQWGHGWTVDVVGSTGKTGGWEKLQVLRICRA
ncbi:MAG: hypothetical protein Q9190_005129 [Brigantiaea leucoxantha]